MNVTTHSKARLKCEYISHSHCVEMTKNDK